MENPAACAGLELSRPSRSVSLACLDMLGRRNRVGADGGGLLQSPRQGVGDEGLLHGAARPPSEEVLRVWRLRRQYLGLLTGYAGLVALVAISAVGLRACRDERACTDGPPPLETRACEDVPSPLGEFWCLCTSHGKQLLLTALGMLVVGNTVRGPMHSVFWALFGCCRPRPRTGATVLAKGYERVAEALQQHLAEGVEGAAQVSCWVDGECVVDIWALEQHKAGGEKVEYDQHTMQMLFSTTKVLESLVVAMLADRGLLSYDAPIANYWPEFGANGKEGITIAELMRHEAGLAHLTQPMPCECISRDAIKANRVGVILAALTPSWRASSSVGNNRRNYHAVTRGWLANEIVRRVDPLHRTIGEFLQEEIVGPLGLTGSLFIGLPSSSSCGDSALSADASIPELKVAPLVAMPFRWTLLQSCLPQKWSLIEVPKYQFPVGIATQTRLGQIAARQSARALNVEARLKPVGDIPIRHGDYTSVFNSAELRRTECPSFNGHGTASALGKIAAALGNGGSLGNVTLLSAAGLAAAAADPVLDQLMPGTRVYTKFTNCGWNVFDDHQRGRGLPARDGFIGWMGLGGSCCMFQPERNLGFAYSMNLMAPAMDPNWRSYRIQKVFSECARAAKLRRNDDII